MNKRLLLPIVTLSVSTVAGFASSLSADELLRRLSWDPPVEGALVVEGDGHGQVLEIVSDSPSGRTVTVLEIEKPGIAEHRYAIVGQLSHEDVEGQGYVEMWSVFPDGSRFFSRTLGQGRAQPMSGSADWRTFALPFDLLESTEKPSMLTVGVVLPGHGTVRLRGLELRQYANDDEPAAFAGDAWWSDRTAALIGGFGGVALGILASLFAWLARHGRARAAVLVGVTAVIVAAVACLIASLVAVSLRQPYSVYYPLVLLGGLGVLILPARLRAMKRHYTELELHRMRRHDLGAR